MKKYFFVFALFCLFICSCTNGLLDSFYGKNQAQQDGTICLSIGDVAETYTNNARLAGPDDGKSYKEVTSWDVTISNTGFSQTTTISTTENGNSSFAVPLGSNYTVRVEGQVPETTQYYCGEATGINVEQNSTANVIVYVERKKEKNGTLNYVITLGENLVFSEEQQFLVTVNDLRNDENSVSVKIPIKNGTVKILENGINVKYNSSSSSNLSIISNENTTTNDKTIKSSFYKIEVSYEDSGKTYYLVLPEPIIEVCDGCSTTYECTVTDTYTSKTYYATTSSSSYNGIVKDFPINIKTLLQNLQTDTNWKDVEIYIPAGENLSAIDFTDYVVDGKTIEIYSGDVKIFQNSYVTDFYISASGKYTDSESVEHEASKNLYDVAQAINNVGYSDKDVKIYVSGGINVSESNLYTCFKNIKSLVLKGTNSSTDYFDFGCVPKYLGTGVGFDFDNVGNVTVSNIKIQNAWGASSRGDSGPFVGLNFSAEKITGTVTVEDCAFEKNTSAAKGESICISGTASKVLKVFIKNCTFTNNCNFDEISGASSSMNGKKGDGNCGVVKTSAYAEITIEGCTFDGNGVSDVQLGSEKSTVTIIDTKMNNNVNSFDQQGNVNIFFEKGNLNVQGKSCGKIRCDDNNQINLSGELQDEGTSFAASFIVMPTNCDRSKAFVTVSVEGKTFADYSDKFIFTEVEGYTFNTTYYLYESASRKIIGADNYETFATSEFYTNYSSSDPLVLVIDSSVYDEMKIGDNSWDNRLYKFCNSINNNTKGITLDLSSYEGTLYKYGLFRNAAKKIILPDNLVISEVDQKGFHSQAFQGSTNLEEIVISDSNPYYKTIDGVLYKKNDEGNAYAIVRYPPAKSGENFTIPEGVIEINHHFAFEGTVNLKTIPNFTQITSFNPDSNSYFVNSSIEELTCSDSITRIPISMFERSKIKKVILTNKVKTIEDRAFAYCLDLTSIKCDCNPTMGDELFKGCTTSITKPSFSWTYEFTPVWYSVSNLTEAPSSGTYNVRTYGDLKALSEFSQTSNLEGVTFDVLNNIEKPSYGTWTPIATEVDATFKGTLNGKGHRISVPMTEYNNTEYGFTGLVGINDGTIENIEYYIEGYSDGGTFSDTTNMVNCTGTKGSYGDGQAGSNVWTGYVGGIAGTNNGTIRNCWNRVNFYTSFLRAGGIAGWNNGTIENCVNTGNIAVYNSAENKPRAGGIAGAMDDKGSPKIINCVNYGTVGLKKDYSYSDVMEYAGGIVGGHYYDDTTETHVEKNITNCYYLENSVCKDWSSSTAQLTSNIIWTISGQNENTYLNYLTVSGCGTFNSELTITAGTAKDDENSLSNCITAQTLSYGTDLLTALNDYVTDNSSNGLKSWKTVDGKVILDFSN